MALDQTANLKKVTASTGYAAGATSITLTTGDGAKLPDPASGEYNLTWWDFTNYPDPADDPNVEIVRVTGKTGDVLTVTRAQESTSDSAKNTGSATYNMILGITAKMITDIANTFGTRGTFTNATLSTGVLTITHSLGLSTPFTLLLTIADNAQKQIIPDEVTFLTNTITVDLTSYGTLTGTWGYYYI